tara:strand:+ start:510 stop:815 length:306 start_codon:yes stop_codon:yes gene_type:complete
MKLLTEDIQPLTEGQKIGEAIYAISGKNVSVITHPDGTIEINWLGEPEIPDQIIREKICELDFYRMMHKMKPQDSLTSAKQKLKDLGLTEEEIKALINSNF